MTLKDKVIIVTGATSGIGLEIVKEAVHLGAKVMIHCSLNSKDAAQKLVDNLGKNTAFVSVDLAKFDDLSNIINKTIDVFGRVDGLVNNAAIFPRNDISTITQKDYDAIFDVNVKALLFLSQAFINTLLLQKTKGAIVNIGSINAYCGQNDLLLYSMSKGAVMTMTRNLADTLATKHIRVNQINVGWTHTEKEHITQIQNSNDDRWHEKISEVFAPRGSILSPNEVAKHTIFWLSDDSAPVSGAIYEVEQYPVIGRNKINA